MADKYKHIHSQTVALYERQAHEWDKERSLSSFFEQQWIDKLLSHLKAGSSVLDVGCGGGQPIAKYLVEKGFAVTGIDTSPTLLDLCRSRCPNGSWIHMDMRQLRLAKKFDSIIAWDSFFHLDSTEQRAVLKNLISHLNPEGALLVTVGSKAAAFG